MHHPSVQLAFAAGVATIRLNRPEVFNSFDTAMARALQQVLEACGNDASVRVVLLTGAGAGFCAGQDLKEAVAPESLPIAEIVAHNYNPIIRKIRELEKPVVAAVNGVAAGAGANLALACDLVVARESAVFIQAFSKIGLVPDSGGTFFLPRLVGQQRASALMLLGDKIPAREAAAMGMIYQAYPDEQFEGKVAELVQRLAKMPTRGLAYTKQLLNDSFNHTLPEQLQREAELQAAAAATEDFREGVQAFLEKRPANFKGQ